MRRIVFSKALYTLCLGAISILLCGALRAQQPVESIDYMRRAHELMMDNLGYFLDGAVKVDLDAGQVDWRMNRRQIMAQMNRIVTDVHALQSLHSMHSFRKFSPEVEELIHRVEGLSFRDLRRWRMAEGLSESQQWYVMVQSALDELKMQAAMELNVHYNEMLKRDLDESIMVEQGSEKFDLDALELSPNSLLSPLDWSASEITQLELSAIDLSEWDPMPSSNAAPEWEEWLERILALLESQEERISELERGSSNGSASWPEHWRSLASDPALNQLHIPETLDIRFPVASAQINLNGKMQLHEIMEIMGRYPQIRVMCTGHADASGERNSNLLLSKRRAQAVQSYLLETGVSSDRVLLNYFGEERERHAGSNDRRVEVAFYLN